MQTPLREWRRMCCAAVLGLALAFGAGCSGDEGLTIKRLSRTRGIPGDWVTIYGSGFQSGGTRSVRIFFGSAQVQKHLFEGDNELKVLVPGGKDMMGKTVDIKLIFEPGGELNYPKAFTFAEPARHSVDDLVEKE